MNKVTEHVPNGFLTRKEIADLYNVSTKTFNRWCAQIGIVLEARKLVPPNKQKQIIDALGRWDSASESL